MTRRFLIFAGAWLTFSMVGHGGIAQQVRPSPLSGKIMGQKLNQPLSQRMASLELRIEAIEYSRVRPMSRDIKKQDIQKANREFVRKKKIRLLISE